MSEAVTQQYVFEQIGGMANCQNTLKVTQYIFIPQNYIKNHCLENLARQVKALRARSPSQSIKAMRKRSLAQSDCA